jgi:hypothetical protein
MTEHDEHRERLRVGILLPMFFLAPVLYVLSIGPVVALVEKTGVGEDAAKVFYLPVVWLHDHTPLEKPLEKWGELWGWH